MMVMVTVWLDDRPWIVKENNPSGKIAPEGGGVLMLLTGEAVKLENPPAVVMKVAVPTPVAVGTVSLVGRTAKFTQ